jgi:hypothetical protein
MTTVDTLLLKIVNFTEPTIEELLPARDSRVLRSLATATNTHYFITENQSRLILKILKENQKKMPIFLEEISTALSEPVWSRKFRKVEQVKKFYIGTDHEDEKVLIIDFTFSSQIRRNLDQIAKQLENLVQINPGKHYTADLTEKNIVKLVDLLSPLDFEIDELVKSHYDTIKSWSESDFRSQFLIGNIAHQNFQKAITADLGIATAIDKNIIKDRSMRYQYVSENAENIENSGFSLVEHIANREHANVWIDCNRYNFRELIKALLDLHRLPVLIIFPNWEQSKLHENLTILKDSLDANSIHDGVGIYFRMPNDEQGKKFNQLISENQYNCKLDTQTIIAGIQAGKIPKFLIKNQWVPMSVISLDNNLRYNKAAVYSQCCDLVITYSDTAPILDRRVK